MPTPVNHPPLNVALAAWKTFEASLPGDTGTTAARLVYDIAVAGVGAENMVIEELMPNIPFVRGGVIKVTESAADSVTMTLAGLLEAKLEAGQ